MSIKVIIRHWKHSYASYISSFSYLKPRPRVRQRIRATLFPYFDWNLCHMFPVRHNHTLFLCLCRIIVLGSFQWRFNDVKKCDALKVGIFLLILSRPLSPQEKGAGSQIRFELSGNWLTPKVPVRTPPEQRNLCASESHLTYKITGFQWLLMLFWGCNYYVSHRLRKTFLLCRLVKQNETAATV